MRVSEIEKGMVYKNKEGHPIYITDAYKYGKFSVVKGVMVRKEKTNIFDKRKYFPVNIKKKSDNVNLQPATGYFLLF